MKILAILWALIAAATLMIQGLSTLCDSPNGCGDSSASPWVLVGLLVLIVGAIAGWQKKGLMTTILTLLPLVWVLCMLVKIFVL